MLNPENEICNTEKIWTKNLNKKFKSSEQILTSQRTRWIRMALNSDTYFVYFSLQSETHLQDALQVPLYFIMSTLSPR